MFVPDTKEKAFRLSLSTSDAGCKFFIDVTLNNFLSNPRLTKDPVINV